MTVGVEILVIGGESSKSPESETVCPGRLTTANSFSTLTSVQNPFMVLVDYHHFHITTKF